MATAASKPSGRPPPPLTPVVGRGRVPGGIRLLARQGGLNHRSVKIPDLLVAATAQLAGVTVWHFDEGYEPISAITGQPTQWLAPRGTL